MHIDSNPLSFILRCTLFALLMYKIYELIKAYVIPFLAQQKKILQKQQMELTEKETLLASTIKRVENQTTQQKKMTALLEKKMQLWHHLTVERYLEEERKQRSLAIRLNTKRKLQQKQLTETKILSEVIPEATRQAQEECAILYEGQKGAVLLKNFIDRLLNEQM